jgi:crotonobetainyl-CoA:carnitine CoA-transferase CaiB-like acyl-CoA transferase
MGIYPLGAFDTANGEYCLVQVSNEHQWKRFCDLLGASELAADARFASNPLRVKNRDALRPLIRDYMLKRSAQDWEKDFAVAGVPVAHVRSTKDVAADPQVRARKMVKPTRLKSGREIPTWGVPFKINEELDDKVLGIPGIDEHRADILAELDRIDAKPRS